MKLFGINIGKNKKPTYEEVHKETLEAMKGKATGIKTHGDNCKNLETACDECIEKFNDWITS